MKNIEWKTLIGTDRKQYPLQKVPVDLDFSKTIGGTTYTVRSHFNKDSDECLLTKVHYLCEENRNLAE